MKRSDSLLHSAEQEMIRQGQVRKSLESEDAFCLIQHKRRRQKRKDKTADVFKVTRQSNKLFTSITNGCGAVHELNLSNLETFFFFK